MPYAGYRQRQSWTRLSLLQTGPRMLREGADLVYLLDLSTRNAIFSRGLLNQNPAQPTQNTSDFT